MSQQSWADNIFGSLLNTAGDVFNSSLGALSQALPDAIETSIYNAFGSTPTAPVTVNPNVQHTPPPNVAMTTENKNQMMPYLILGGAIVVGVMIINHK